MLLDDISATLYSKAKEVQESMVTDITTMDQAPKDTDETTDDVILRFGWCGSEECGHTFEDTTGFKMLGTLFKAQRSKCVCIVCAGNAEKQAYASHPM